ncbi:DctP family TRAP transporter solute-binding subunit [Pseudovibrio exalbescens]|uniref:C4-dicarboxylate ABC transporter substrate-binding protein n=1 Tax=Pseudovibrio exalbescens TaxID=197461 RepID=A0A1U7JGG9_9HYPH|nr:DctP family TRAP transporter solute-binding subunit [Pseudovibrio exalbescens]OKL43829.1 C4-dicarboxylate ABC transporter substrate-binding protein [Pseudovibrio exalbescens]
MKLFKTLMAATALVGLGLGAAAAQTEISVGTQDNEASYVYKGIMAAKDKLEEVSGGEMTLTVFPSAQLGDFKTMTSLMQAGELGAVITGYPDMSYMIPELKLIGAPYVVNNFDHLQEILDGPFGDKMDEEFMKRGIKQLDVWYYGTRHMTSNKPINSIEDMKGLRVRTPNVPFLIAFAENTGASPAPVAFQEVYLALQTNQVDAQENPLPTIDAMKFYEVQSHIALTGHFVASAAVNLSASLWQDLSDQEKAWVEEAFLAGGDVADMATIKAEQDLLEDFKDRGLTITEPDRVPFQQAMKPYYDELEEQFGKGSIAALIGK